MSDTAACRSVGRRKWVLLGLALLVLAGVLGRQAWYYGWFIGKIRVITMLPFPMAEVRLDLHHGTPVVQGEQVLGWVHSATPADVEGGGRTDAQLFLEIYLRRELADRVREDSKVLIRYEKPGSKRLVVDLTPGQGPGVRAGDSIIGCAVEATLLKDARMDVPQPR